MQAPQAERPQPASPDSRSHRWRRGLRCLVLFSPGLVLLSGWFLFEYDQWLHPEDSLKAPISVWAWAPTRVWNPDLIIKYSFAGSALLCLLLVCWWSRRTEPGLRRLWEIPYFTIGVFCLNVVAVFVIFLITMLIRHSL
jgi:hypothetical protein